MIFIKSSSDSGWKTIISSKRLMNSGLKILRTSCRHFFANIFVLLNSIRGAKSHASFLFNHPGADIRSHNDNSIFEIDMVPERIGQVAILQHLKQNIENTVMSFFDFIEQHNGVRIPFHKLRQLPSIFITDISGREPINFETECFSINSDISNRTKAFSLPNKCLARDLASSVLPTPVGPNNKKEPIGLFGFFRSDAGAADGPGDRIDCRT